MKVLGPLIKRDGKPCARSIASWNDSHNLWKAFAPDGTPYVAYHFNNPGNVDALMIAYPGGGDGNCGVEDPAGYWDCYTVQTGEGVEQHASLALDGDGYFHIAYHDADSGDLWYATSRSATNCGPGNSWSCYAVDSNSDVVGQYASLYMDSDDRFHIRILRVHHLIGRRPHGRLPTVSGLPAVGYEGLTARTAWLGAARAVGPTGHW